MERVNRISPRINFGTDGSTRVLPASRGRFLRPAADCQHLIEAGWLRRTDRCDAVSRASGGTRVKSPKMTNT
jgi:hypothetical protein